MPYIEMLSYPCAGVPWLQVNCDHFTEKNATCHKAWIIYKHNIYTNPYFLTLKSL